MSPDLAGRIIALSSSPPNDLGRLGFPRAEYDRILFDLCARIVRAGGRLLYGGHLGKDNITAPMYEYVARAYGGGASNKKPFVHLLPLSEFRRAGFAQLHAMQVKHSAFVETRVIVDDNQHATLGRRGDALSARQGKEPPTTIANDDDLRAFAKLSPLQSETDALTAMRNVANDLVAARIAIGGKRGDLGVPGDDFRGAAPGVYQETLTTIAQGKPTVVLAAYGGAARDIAIDLGLLDADRQTPYLGAIQAGYAAARDQMRALRASLPAADLASLKDFAAREDSEALAHDAVAWIAAKLAGAPAEVR